MFSSKNNVSTSTLFGATELSVEQIKLEPLFQKALIEG